MNENLTVLYKSCRPKEALASQEQYGSANTLLGNEVEKFAELIVKECAKRIDYWESKQGEHCDDLLKHFGIEE